MPLTSYPARWIDRMLRETPSRPANITAKQLKVEALTRAIGITLLPLCSALDTLYFSGRSVIHLAKFKASSHPDLKEWHLRQMVLASKMAVSCFRATIYSPGSLLWPEVVSSHFVPPPAEDGFIRPYGGLYEGKGYRFYPKTVEDVQELVATARRFGRKIAVVGAGLSQGKQALPVGERDFLLDMSRISRCRVDPETKIATVGGGTPWIVTQDVADSFGLAVEECQASPPFSFGGSVAANCHGWDHGNSPLRSTIRSITIVDAEGDLKKLTPSDELFNYVVGGWGLFGIIVEGEIELTKNRYLFEWGKSIPIESYTQFFRRYVERDETAAMSLYRLSLGKKQMLEKGYLQVYTKGLEAPPSTPSLEREAALGSVKDRILFNIFRLSGWARELFWSREIKNILSISHKTRNELMRPPINAALSQFTTSHSEWLQEYFLPEKELAPFLNSLSAVLKRNEVALLNASVRFVNRDPDTVMGYAKGGDRFAVVLYFTQSMNEEEVDKTRNWVREVIDELIERGGTFYLPYCHLATEEQVKKCYPGWEQFVAMKERADPGGLFSNGFYSDYLQPR